MGTQPKLGLWSQRRPGVVVGDRADPRAGRAHLRELGSGLAVAANIRLRPASQPYWLAGALIVIKTSLMFWRRMAPSFA
jgi:hypothetical protein